MATPAGNVVTKGAQVYNLIQRIGHCIDAGEYNHDPYEFREARRLLNNELPQLVDEYVKEEREKARMECQAQFSGLICTSDFSMERSELALSE